MIASNALRLDPRLGAALLEVLRAGRLPLPDRLLQRSPEAAPADTHPALWHEQCRVSATGSGLQLRLATGSGMSLEACFVGAALPTPASSPGGAACAVSGSITLNGQVIALEGARGVLRACGGMDALAAAPTTRATLLLASGAMVVLDGEQVYHHAAAEGGGAAAGATSGAGAAASACTPTPTPEPWLSTQTFSTYPQHAQHAASGLSLWASPELEPATELVSLLACPGVWMGRVQCSGGGLGTATFSLGGQALASLDGFFRAVGTATRAAVVREYPSTLTPEKIVQMAATGPAYAAQVQGAHPGQLEAGLIAPVRHLIDAGGKSWRSYGILAACDAVGGASHAHTDFLALAELLHVGSLIVDDVQDESPLRRGRRAVHLQYSPAVAINAATAAYFYCERIIMRRAASRPPADTLRILEHYFGCMRAGHAGQALDIGGLDYMMAEAIESGGGALAEQRLLAVHMLKTGVPAASLLRMGAVLGGGSEAQVMALGCYYEAVGCAFQIMDDVRNLRGVFSGSADKAGAGVELKVLGEDITAGKVTFPLVKALQVLPKEAMAALWEAVRAKPSDRGVVDGIIAQLEACGAIDACVAHAARLVEEGYSRVDAVLPESLWKCFLRAFGAFLVELPR